MNDPVYSHQGKLICYWSAKIISCEIDIIFKIWEIYLYEYSNNMIQ